MNSLSDSRAAIVSVSDIKATTTVRELLEHSLGWVALVVHQSITDEVVQEALKQWLDSPIIYQLEMYSQVFSVLATNSPRFYVYENELGFGKPLAFRNGPACKFAGNVAACPGYQEEGSIDLEICLSPETMAALESDKEFMEAVSLPHIPGREVAYINRSLSKI
ncbi:hypothetical protein Cgig2_020587 [Carnegiea gigantea]|uniref:Uncharacterized protein n=1 Tax=Carnegiea gigantea TaxID=171969 RepID=A0A9Q1JXD4_9CARY|nr:hypothetical protein Cgig2_020587 [Carnegiea gigantea]